MTSVIETFDTVGGEGRKTFIVRRISIAHFAMLNGNTARCDEQSE